MLKVRLDLIPHGIGMDEPLWQLNIVNNLTGTYLKGNYNVTFFKDQEIKKQLEVVGHERDEGALRLLYEALKEYYDGDTSGY